MDRKKEKLEGLKEIMGIYRNSKKPWDRTRFYLAQWQYHRIVYLSSNIKPITKLLTQRKMKKAWENYESSLYPSKSKGLESQTNTDEDELSLLLRKV